jgi:hypothetical protein
LKKIYKFFGYKIGIPYICTVFSGLDEAIEETSNPALQK